MKKKIVLCIMLVIIMISNIKSFAVEESKENCIFLSVSNTELRVGEEVVFTINLSNINVSAFDIHISFDDALLEYVSGPDNTNVLEDKLITIWYDETGGEKSKQNCELVKYAFKLKEIGSQYIGIQGEFYNAQGNHIESLTDGIVIRGNEEEQVENIEISEESEVPSNDSKLKILRLNHEGITPIFSPEITEYYFLTDSFNYLEVIAVPENKNAKVNITGNTNFVEGLNTIVIDVISQDTTSKTTYKIFVTKTSNLDSANANLETLAIENVILEPEFANTVYEYHTSVSDTMQKLNILAIPEKQSATVQIMGGEKLEFGNNTINISVIAENGFTKKLYTIQVYKRNEEEQKIEEKQKDANIQKLNAILEEQEDDRKQEIAEEDSLHRNIQKKLWIKILFSLLAIIIIIITVFRIKKRSWIKIKNKSK